MLFYLALPFVFIRVLWRARKEPRYSESPGQRLGRFDGNGQGAVWVHAVSAGETIACIGLVKALVAKGHRVVLTNMTPAGRERAESLLSKEIEIGNVSNQYVPYDLPIATSRFLSAAQPCALIVIDTELWPNMVATCSRRQVPVYVVNGRLSERSAAGYDRVRSVSQPMLTAITCIFAQSESQAQRFRSLGASNVVTAGSIKFDATLPSGFEPKIQVLAERFEGRREIMLAASTHAGEESEFVNAYLHYGHGSSLLVIAPRHIHRMGEVEALLDASGLRFQKHSQTSVLNPDTQVYLVDTMGELINFYGVCTNAFVGGSLVDVGGHNPMEPGMLGVPMMMGPYRRNIADIAELFETAGAMYAVTKAEDIASFWHQVEQPAFAAAMKSACMNVMQENRGALQRVIDQLDVDLRPQGSGF